MAGILLTFGQVHFLKVLFTGEASPGTIYLGLIQNGNIGTTPDTHPSDYFGDVLVSHTNYLNSNVGGVGDDIDNVGNAARSFLIEVSKAASAAPGAVPGHALPPVGYSRLALTVGNSSGSDALFGGAVGAGSSAWNRTTVAGLSSVVRATEEVFTVTDTSWYVGGYFVALGGVWGVADAIWAESFITQQQGEKVVGDKIRMKAKFEQKDDHE